MRINNPQMTQMSADLRKGKSAPNHLRESAKSADHLSPMNPREIEVHIEELVLHGFAPGDRWRIGDVLESELRGLLMEKGLPVAWHQSPEKIEAGPLRAASLTKPSRAGRQIARTIWKGGTE